MTQHLFIITSAINTRFGAFSKEERLEQTCKTMESVYARVPDAKICIFESSGIPVEPEIIDHLHKYAQWVVNMSNDKTLHEIQASTENWDIVKNLCEMTAFNSGLRMLDDQNVLVGIDRIHKLSGRYLLNDDFNVALYDTIPTKIALTPKYTTQFEDMEVPYQYMSRLWSWPMMHHETVKEFYQKAILEFLDRMKRGKYIDIEHLLYYFLPPEHIAEIRKIGVQGLLGQNAAEVNN